MEQGVPANRSPPPPQLSLSHPSLGLYCGPGSVALSDRTACEPCGSGTAVSDDLSICEPCPQEHMQRKRGPTNVRGNIEFLINQATTSPSH